MVKDPPTAEKAGSLRSQHDHGIQSRLTVSRQQIRQQGDEREHAADEHQRERIRCYSLTMEEGLRFMPLGAWLEGG
jgi:hypothetical protein